MNKLLSVVKTDKDYQRNIIYTNYPISPRTKDFYNEVRKMTLNAQRPNGEYLHQFVNHMQPVNIRTSYMVPPLKQVPQRVHTFDKIPRALIKTPENSRTENIFPINRQHSQIPTPVSNKFIIQRAVPIKTSIQPQNDNILNSKKQNLTSPAFVQDKSTNNVSNNFQTKLFGTTEREKMFIFTGTVEKILKWNKIFVNHFCYFEVIGSVISIQEGAVRQQKVMLLRDKKGPILQIIYYESTHIEIVDFDVGKMLRCVGTMNGKNVFNAVSIRSASVDEIRILQRLSLICDQAVAHYLSP